MDGAIDGPGVNGKGPPFGEHDVHEVFDGHGERVTYWVEGHPEDSTRADGRYRRGGGPGREAPGVG